VSNQFRLKIQNPAEEELVKRLKASGNKKDIPPAIMEKFDDEGDIHEMSYLPLKKYPAGHGIPGGTMGRSKTKMPSGSGSPLKGHLSEFDDQEEFDDGGFFEEQEEHFEEEPYNAFDELASNQSVMFSVLSAMAERMGLNFNDDGSYYFSDHEPEYPLGEFGEDVETHFDELGNPYYFADDGEAYYFKDNGNGKDNDDDDWRDRDAQPPAEQRQPTAMKYEEFSDPALNSRLTALEMREKHRNHADGVNQLVEHYAAQLSEYHLDSEDVDRMREIAFSSDDPEQALHQFSQVVAKNVPTDPPHTFTDYLSHESYGQNVPEDVQQFAEYGPDMYSAAESLWQPYQEYKSSTNSQIEFKDYVKAQGVLGSTTNTGEGN